MAQTQAAFRCRRSAGREMSILPDFVLAPGGSHCFALAYLPTLSVPLSFSPTLRSQTTSKAKFHICSSGFSFVASSAVSEGLLFGFDLSVILGVLHFHFSYPLPSPLFPSSLPPSLPPFASSPRTSDNTSSWLIILELRRADSAPSSQLPSPERSFLRAHAIFVTFSTRYTIASQRASLVANNLVTHQLSE